ncbi:MAG TPA: YbhB/YbcL family Raf kinase inhibitor-like protein [Polyangiaceae bacterium]|nr:YbhB/YbcL family Raf kinase inhibitor-like protein [Polyangiaceae bacterium]
MAFAIRSSAFAQGGPIPTEFTCEGQKLSPEISWSDVPEKARALALIVDDPDAPDPDAPRRVFTHWVLYNIPPDAAGLREGATPGLLPEGTRLGLNDFGEEGWGAPCPPRGRHRYFFKLYALDEPLPDLGLPTKAELERAMQGHVLAEAELVGTYAKAH